MTNPWNSLFFPSDDHDAIAAAVRDSLTALGYTLYNPFGLMPGKSYPQSVRLFVMPAAGGWVRVLGTPDQRQFAALPDNVYVALDGDQGQIVVYQNGAEVDSEPGLLPWLRPGTTADSLRIALTNPPQMPPLGTEPQLLAVPLDALPDDVRSLAGGVDMGQAEKMFSRLSDKLVNKAGGADSADAAKAMMGGGGPDWNSEAGRRIRAVMACLSMPAHWREPGFATLRDAYQLHERRRRKPDARLYPGDSETMNTVPDALTCIPVYGGM